MTACHRSEMRAWKAGSAADGSWLVCGRVPGSTVVVDGGTEVVVVVVVATVVVETLARGLGGCPAEHEAAPRAAGISR